MALYLNNYFFSDFIMIFFCKKKNHHLTVVNQFYPNKSYPAYIDIILTILQIDKRFWEQ